MWREPERYEPGRGGFASWLLATVHHKAVDAVRREEAVRRRRALACRRWPASTASDRRRPAEDAGGAAAARRAGPAGAAARCRSSQREALALAYYGGYTQREIAALTNTPLGTVKTRMHRAMHQLRTCSTTWPRTWPSSGARRDRRLEGGTG